MGYLHRFIASKFLYREEDGTRIKKILPTVRISAIGIALGVSLILLSVFIVQGFKLEIREKINGFVGNIKIFHPENAHNQYTIPLETPKDLLEKIRGEIEASDHSGIAYTFADQMGVFKTDSAYRGVVIHGVDSLYNKEFFSKYLIRGECPSFDDIDKGSLLISSYLSQYLNIDVDSTTLAYFFDEGKVKVRKFVVKGIFRTGFKDYDEHLAIGNIKDIRSVLGWSTAQSGGIEIKLSDDRNTEEIYHKLYDILAQRVSDGQGRYTMLTAQEMNPVMYGWVDLLDTNVRLILILMIAVASMTIITGVIVIILEKVQAISTLKALGQSNQSLRKIFHHMAVRILLKGLLWGNSIALIIAGLQSYFKIFRLDASQYYIEYVPIHISVWAILLTNALTIVALYLVIFIPTTIISNIRPAEGVRFD